MRSVWLLLGFIALLTGCQEAPAGSGSSPSSPLVASGTIWVEEIHVASDVGGRIVAIQTEVGAEVHAGDVLVELDTTPLLAKTAGAESAVAVAEAELQLLLAQPSAAEIAAAQASVRLAQAAEQGALVAWNNALNAVENPQELEAQIVDARGQFELAEQAVELAEAQLQQQQLLRDQHEPGSLQRDMAEYQVQAARAALAAAEDDENAASALLNWLYAIRDEPLLQAAQASLAEGNYLVQSTATHVSQVRLDDLLAGATMAEIAVAEAKIALAQAQLQILEVQREKFTIRSAGQGLVLEQSAYPGEVVAPAATILTIGDISAVKLTVFVPENRLGHVVLNQATEVTVDSFPGRLFQGRVIRIGTNPEFTPRNVTTIEERLNTFYAVDILLDNPAGELKPGMPADAVFAPPDP